MALSFQIFSDCLLDSKLTIEEKKIFVLKLLNLCIFLSVVNFFLCDEEEVTKCVDESHLQIWGKSRVKLSNYAT